MYDDGREKEKVGWAGLKFGGVTSKRERKRRGAGPRSRSRFRQARRPE